MRIDPKISSLLIDCWRRYGFEAALAFAIAAVVRVIAAAMTTPVGTREVAATFMLFLVVLVPLVCLIAFWAALGEESTLSRAGRAIIRLLGLYFCVVLPASYSYQASQAHLDAVLAKGMAIMFAAALIPAGIVRIAGWRLRRIAGFAGEEASRADRWHQFGLRELFRVTTTLCVLMALAAATQRAYNTTLEELILFDHLRIAPSVIAMGAAVSGIGALSLFSLWFGDYGGGRAWLLLIHFAAWMSINALSCAIGSVLNLEAQPSIYWLVLGMWGIFFVPMTIASHVAQARGWRFVRRKLAPVASGTA